MSLEVDIMFMDGEGASIRNERSRSRGAEPNQRDPVRARGRPGLHAKGGLEEERGLDKRTGQSSLVVDVHKPVLLKGTHINGVHVDI
jgi:hypothetical protein